MAGVVNSLFGITPEQLQGQRDVALQQEAYKFSQLDPFQQATMGIYSGARRLGDAVGGLMGAQDPELQRITARQKALEGVDITDASALKQAAMQLSQAGDHAAAQELITRATALENNKLDTQVKYSQIFKNTREGDKAKTTDAMANAAALASSRAPQGSPEWDQIYQAELTRLTTQNSQAQWDIKEVGVAEGTREPIYTIRPPGKEPMQVKQVITPEGPKWVPYNGGVDRTTAKVNASSTSIQQDEFSKRRGAAQSGSLEEATQQASKASVALRTLNTMDIKNEKGTLYTGPQADLVKEAANFLASAGLLNKNDTLRLTDSTSYDKLAKDLVMQDLDGKLGAQVSDADRKYVEARIPQLSTNPEARRELIAKLKEIHQKKIDRWKRMNQHANKYGNLNDFDFSDGEALATVPATDGAALVQKYLNPPQKK